MRLGFVVAMLLPSFSTLPSSAGRTRLVVRAHQHLSAVAIDVPRPRSSRLVGRGGPVEFHRGACVAFAPFGGWNGRTVFVDPGHGGVDSGALGAGSVAEKRVTLAIGLRASALLRAAGYRVVMSRVVDSTVARLGPRDLAGRLLSPAGEVREIVARNVCADSAHADVLVGIHLNAFADPAAGGAETIYCPQRSFGRRNRRLAMLTQRAVLASLRGAGWTVPDRGLRGDRTAGARALTARAAAYGHLFELGPADPPWFRRPSLMPGVIVEPLFLTNAAEARIATSARGQLAIARGVLHALTTYFRSRAG